jgi:general nucleoside transport system ATP-binding protein
VSATRAERSDRQPEGASPLVELIGITKAYPGVVANDDVTLSVRRGEIHCLLGENGAGKSTLIGILSGLVRPDAGRIRIDGRDVSIDSPRRALFHGIGTVYQHSTLIPELTVLENLMLGDTRSLRLDIAGATKRLRELAEQLAVEIDPREKALDLALGRQQQVEIIKALWRGSRVLVLDEPTSMLTPQAFSELERVVTRLKEQGQGIIFITHKLHEALSLGDKISVLRQGRLVGELGKAELETTSVDDLRLQIVRMMFGDEAPAASDAVELRGDIEQIEQVHDRRRFSVEETVLELDDVSVAGQGTEFGIEHVSLRLGLQEILGVAGVDGNGQQALAEVVAGQRHPTAGDIRLYEAPITRLSVHARQKLGLRYVTDDRLGEGTVPPLSVSLNLFLKRIGQRPFWRFGRLQRRAVDRKAAELVKEFDVRTPSVATRTGTLSGGNIQKVVLARELSFGPKVVVFNKPTYGLDLKTTTSVRNTIRDLADGGGAALVISTDLDELIEICDRIAVLSRGRLVGIVENRPGVAEQIGNLMVGDEVEAAA